MATPLSEFMPLELWPTEQLTSAETPVSLLDRILVTDVDSQPLIPGPGSETTLGLSIADPVVLNFPGLDGPALVLGGGDATALTVHLHAAPGDVVVRISGGARLRFPREWLRPVIRQGETWVDDPSRPYAEIAIQADMTVDQDWTFTFEGSNEFTLAPAMIASTGFVLEGTVAIDLSTTQSLPETLALGLGPQWRGVVFKHLTLHLPSDLNVPIVPDDLTLTNFHIGSGGISGSVSGHWSPTVSGSHISGNGAGSLFGMAFGLKTLELSLLQNAITGLDFKGVLALPFFEHALDVDLGLDLDGNFTVTVDSATGLTEFTVSPGGADLMHVKVERLTVEQQSGVLSIGIGGSVKPLVGGLDWPTFDLKKLVIDSKGNVYLDGGWLDLPTQYALDFYGFQLELTKLGFGKTEDGGKWIGFSGGLNLVDGLPAGASAEGLKVTWYDDGSHDPKITLDGVGVELTIPNAVAFKGHVAYREFVDSQGNTVHQFDGDIKLKLLALDMEVDAVLVIGSEKRTDGSRFTFFALYITAELPAGIPLWSTGLALYGMAGLFAIQMEPDKRPDEAWYGVGPSDGWYKRPAIGVTDLAHKWRNEEGSLALGAGLTLGTVSDNGFTFSGRMMLVLVFPGPILMLEGKASLLKERAKLSDEPVFRALAVLDGRAGSLLFGLDAQYKVGSGGELLDIRGGAEAYFDFHDLDRWHLYLGLQDPREKRIRARLFNLYESNAYFMLDAHSLRTGAWAGYDKRWKAGPVKITFEAWLETNVMVSWKPVHFHGDLWAHGKVALRVFGHGFSLSLDAKLAGDVFDPFHILAELSVELDLPWPLPNVDVDFSLEWGPELTPPPIPMVLKDVAIEHFKVTTSWPLPRTSLLLPNFDHDGFIGAPSGPSVPANLNALPVVPLDCRPHITFGRPVHDAALVGVNPQPPTPAVERIGDPASNQGPATVKYMLKGVTLEKFSGGGWTAVARKADSPNPPGVPELFGSWAPVPGPQGGSATQSVGQVKLWLWSKTPFDYTRGTSGAWDEWFTDNYPGYPCIPDAPGKHICCDFTRYRIGARLDVPHTCDPEMLLVGGPVNLVRVERLRPQVAGIDRAACFRPGSSLQVQFTRPARHADIHLLSRPTAETTCVDFAEHANREDKNPLAWHGITFTVFGSTGAQAGSTWFMDIGGVRSLNAGFRTQIDLPEASDWVTLTLQPQGSAMKVEALDGQGQVVANGDVPPGTSGAQTVVLTGQGILKVNVTAPSNETFIQKVCYTSAGVGDVTAVVAFANGTHSAPLAVVNDHIVVDQEGIVGITVQGGPTFCVVQVCADLGADPQEVLERQEMVTHLHNSTARWSQVGDVLEPNTVYRLKIRTRAEAVGEDELAGWTDNREQEELAYFRTEGPPGLTRLSVPLSEPNPDKFDSGLDDLARYVKQTVPPTVPPPGQPPRLPKPVYRAYDVGVEFNEDYVDQMYRMAGRDLGLYLYDNNNEPVRDAAGRLIVRPNEWGRVETTSLDASEQRWIQVVNSSTCAVVSETTIPKDVKLSAGAPGQVLKPDAVHEARLVPLLVHGSFARLAVGATASGPGGVLGRWRIVDQGTSQGPSQWRIAETAAPVTRYVVQTTNIGGGSADGADPVKPGSLLIYGADPNLPVDHADQPGQWTDYRLTAFVRNEDKDAIGLVFRYGDANNYYRFSMDAERRYRRLVRVVNGVHTVLDQDDRGYQPNVDYAVTVEAIGPSLRVYLDGEPILAGEDAAHSAGGIGLYCWASEKARFFDIKVDDFRADPGSNGARTVYKFPFTTSKFAHFTHHAQSFDDKTWRGQLAAGAPTAGWIAAANVPGSPVTDAEARAFDELAHAVLGSAADGFPDGVEVTRVEQNGHTVGFLVQTSEPFDWSRIALDMAAAPTAGQLPSVTPEGLKLVDASFATSQPAEESVSLVARETLDLRGHSIETYQLPGPIQAAPVNDYLFEDFNADGQGLLFEETFRPNALDHYTVLDQGKLDRPSAWSVSGGAIRQTSDIGSEDDAPSDNAKPGGLAITGDPQWTAVRIQARLMSTDNDGIGLVFRYQDAKNYYRFATDNERHYRRLVKCVNGEFTTLWEDMAKSYTPNVTFELQFDLFGSRLVGLLDHAVLFDVTDDTFKSGQIGLYVWKNSGAHFQALRVETLAVEPVLAKPDMTSLTDWTALDPAEAVDGPSIWRVDSTGIRQRAKTRVAGEAHSGAHLVTGQMWDDIQFSVDLQSAEDGAMGALIRYQDERNYYRFSMHRLEKYRRLEKCVGGRVSLLWETGDDFELDQTYRLSLQAVGSTLRGFLDGQPLFAVADTDIARGRVGLYTWNNGGATFRRAWVLNLANTVGSLRVFDAPGLAGQSVWRTRAGELQQRSVIGDAAAPYLGTHAIAPTTVPAAMRLVVEARSETDKPFGVVFRYQDESNYYRFSVSAVDHTRRLLKMVDGLPTTLWQGAGGYSLGATHRFTVDTLGNRLVGYFDGERLFEVHDSSFTGGRVGVYASRNDAVAFDFVQVSPLPMEASALFTDQFAHNNVADWTFVSEATTGGPAQWSTTNGVLTQTSAAYKPPVEAASLAKQGLFAVAGEPTWGDIVFRARLQSDTDHAIGVMFRYRDQNNYYRFSMDRAQKYRRLVKNVGGVFTRLWEDDFAFEAGRAYEVVIVASGSQVWGYFDGVPMFVVEDAEHSAGRVGLYCWQNPGAKFSAVAVLPMEAAFSDWVFEDDFPYLALDRWTFTDAGATHAPSKWSVSGQRLVQTSSIAGNAPRQGTYAVAQVGGRAGSDYRFTASMASTTGGVMGMAVRYRDADNHYRFEIGAGPAGRRLVRVVGGVEAELWSDAQGYPGGQPLLASLDCVGHRLTCYVNGVKLGEVVDDALREGGAALFAFNNPGVAFDGVRVQAAAWQTYYRFGQPAVVPAGQRLRVLACAAALAPAPLPHVQDVFVAGPGEQGHVHFVGSACDLRVRDPQGKAQHTRTFLRSSRYAPVTGMRLLRRADGCGFFIALPAATPEGSRFEKAAYRLKLTYRLDNTASNANSQIQREAGLSNPETTPLDLPW